MRLSCKVVAVLLSLGSLLLLYLLGGSADEATPKAPPGKSWLRAALSGPGGASAPSPFAGVRPLGAAQVSKRLRQPRLHTKPGRRSAGRQDKFGSVSFNNLYEMSPFSNAFSSTCLPDYCEDHLRRRKSNWLSSELYVRGQLVIFSPSFFFFLNVFFPKVILKDVDSLLYVDTDVLFLRPIDDIWRLLKQFNSTQLAAMAPEHEIPKIGWYSRFARHPYYGMTGVNSGVMLMNLTRIRNTQFKNSLIPTGLAWEDMLYPLYQKYKNYITWGDQDLLNIIFYFNPECLYVFPCQWNYRPDHCMYGSNCKGAEQEGVSVLHGNRGVYHDDKQPTFKALYEVMRDFPFQDNLFQSMYYPLQLKFLETVHTLCGRIPQVFLKQIEKTMKRVYEKHVIVHVRSNRMYY
ncbi:glucoside xylosyltransferase 2 [Gracilinanus agilis]|uniref:glucoside xylosyltransferase 2 n=1 Tax=Gracilinanus agilis TaxID=191870 RepID=UPI001CFDFA77|nr:glucoside xylosyltransferase 2 [Gracilinanus agilis]